MNDPKYIIRTMNRKELDIAVEWAAVEGWNPGLHDADAYFTADPNGFLMGFLDDEPISSISVVKYGATFGFIGFYIVKPEYRGMGYGIRIWKSGLTSLEGRNIGLDGVVDQQDNYKKSGFKPAYRNIRYEGKAFDMPYDDKTLADLKAVPLESTVSYDRPFFPENRAHFLRSWVLQPGAHALGIIENGNLTGYGVIRPCRTGFKIGPLYADNPINAESLFRALISKIESSKPFYLDVPEVNPSAVRLAESHGMKTVFETARMYTGKSPVMPLNRIFGVTSFEIG